MLHPVKVFNKKGKLVRTITGDELKAHGNERFKSEGHKNVTERECKDCGVTFNGPPRRKFCDACQGKRRPGMTIPNIELPIE